MPFYCGERSVGICIVLDPKKSSAYPSEYATGFFWPAASHLPAAHWPRNEGLLRQAPRAALPVRLPFAQIAMFLARPDTLG